MSIRQLLRTFVPLAVAAAACSRGSERAQHDTGVVEEVHRDFDSELAGPAQWVVRSAAEWEEMRRRIGPRSTRMEFTVRPDFAREMLVVAAAGEGSSDDPRVEFDGFEDHGRMRIIRVRYSARCDAAQDVTRAYVVGRLPRWDGETKVVAQRVSDC